MTRITPATSSPMATPPPNWWPIPPGTRTSLPVNSTASSPAAARRSSQPVAPRRVLGVFGDGHDTASRQTLEQAIELAQRYFVTVYAVSTSAYGFDNPDRGQLERLATDTGGHVEYPLANPYSAVPGHLSQPSDAGNYALPVGSGAYTQKMDEAISKAASAVQGEVTRSEE